MATKKQPVKNTQTLMGFGEIKMNDEGGVVIQGFANKKVVDRGNELIAPDAWDLENYKKNPVILYNHGFDSQLGGTPIGTATEIKPTEDGLYIKAKLSGLNDPMINRIRGLVKEKILRAFSVGFNAVDTVTDSKTGLRTIKQAELFEVSIVGVPMNQDSLFELSAKAFNKATDEELRSNVLSVKGSWVAAAIHNAVYEKEKNEKLEREAILEALLEKTELEAGALDQILLGNVTPIPEAVLSAVAEVLGLDLEELKKLDAGDLEVQNNAESNEEESEGSSEGSEDAGGQGTEAEASSQGTSEGNTSEETMGKAGKGTDEASVKDADYQACVSEKISTLLQEGKDQDQAVAIAINSCSEKGVKPTKEHYKKFFQVADELVSKQADQGVTQPPTTEISVEKTAAAETDFGSPMLDAQKQSNILLGALISEMQKISVKLDAMVAPTKVEAPTQEAPAPEQTQGTEGDAEKNTQPETLKYVLDSAEACEKARAAFKAEASSWAEPKAARVSPIHGTIVKAQLSFGAVPGFDEKDPLDVLLPAELKDKLIEMNTKALDSLTKRLDNVRKRLSALGA